MTPLRLTIPGAPRTKKNHGAVVQKGARRFHIPSAAWTAWCDEACAELVKVKRRAPRGAFPLPDAPYNIAATFYRDAERGDAIGYYQGLADVLQAAGIVSDDRWLEAWDGSRLALDRRRPRVEVTITPLAPPAAPTRED